MKRALYVTLGVVLLVGVGLALYGHWLFVFYPEHAVARFIGNKDHQTVFKARSEYDWYIKAAIPVNDADAVLKRYPFRAGYSPAVLQGKLDNPYVSSCQNCWSYFEGNGHGLYSYLLAIVSADKKTLQLCENFGD